MFECYTDPIFSADFFNEQSLFLCLLSWMCCSEMVKAYP